jgi:DNA-binding NarL/FixJ family response regulator
MADLGVLVVAEDTLSRAGLAALVAAQPGLAVAGQVPASADLAGALDVYRPQLLLWDMGWNAADGLARLAAALEALEPLAQPVAVLLQDAAHAGEAWSAGARALLPRDVDGPHLAAALGAAAQGLVVLDPLFAGSLVSARGGGLPQASAEALTPRETEVLRLMAEGLPNKAIARRLNISEHTVKFHVNAILGKLGVESRTEAVVRATRLGIVLL